MEYRGKSTFVAVAWLCGSACNIYDGDSLKNQQQRAQPATAARPRDFRGFDILGLRSPFVMINPRASSAGAPSAEPPKNAPVAGTQAPIEMMMDQARRAALERVDSDDAGVTLAPAVMDAGTRAADAGAREADAGTRDVDAGARAVDAGRIQKIETGIVDAGRPRPVAKSSAACRGELGFEMDGRCYFMLDEKVSWNVGRDHCYEHDAHLASVTSEHESDLIASFELEHDVWIGFNCFGAANFSWLTNEKGSFTNWQEGAPRKMQESGALIKAGTGLWTNRAVPELHAVLCETERKAPDRL